MPKTLFRLFVAFVALLSVMAIPGGVEAQTPSEGCKVGTVEPFRVRSFLSAEALAGRTNPLNPASSSQDFMVLPRIYESLMEVRSDNLQPGLAETVTSQVTSEGGQLITFGLRDDVVWHDGESFTAEDVAFSIMLFRDQSGLNTRLEPVDEVEVVDESTVRVWAADPSYLFMRTVAGTVMVPEHIWSTVTDVASFENAEPVGTGPFAYAGAADFRTVSDPSTGEMKEVPLERHMERFEQYWGGCSKVRELHVIVDDPLASPSSPIDAIKDNQVDMWLELGTNTATIDAANAEDAVGLHLQPASGFRYLAFNFRRSPTADPAFRQAIAHLIDRDGSISQADAVATPVRHLVLDHFGEWQNPDATAPEFDPVAARQILEDAGYFDASGSYVGDPVEVLAPETDPIRVTFAQSLAEQARAIGVPVNASVLGFSEIVDRAFGPDHDFDMFILSWGLANSVDYLEAFFSTGSGFNTPGISVPDLDAELSILVTANERAAAVEAARRAQEILSAQLPYAVLYTTLTPTFYDPEFTSYHTVNGDAWLFNNETLLHLESSLPPGLQGGLPPGLEGREPPPPFQGRIP